MCIRDSSTIPGVKEDVTEIVLNVKGIIAKLHCDGPKTVYIEAAGEGEVKALSLIHISYIQKQVPDETCF